jgi:hypothetical protein
MGLQITLFECLTLNYCTTNTIGGLRILRKGRLVNLKYGKLLTIPPKCLKLFPLLQQLIESFTLGVTIVGNYTLL